MKKIYIGAAYYPELWEESEIDKDIERCKELGINCLRVGEFAWSKMEPKEGQYEFDWLKRVVDKLYENGIYTLMCTPTCTPPRWLFGKYEETKRLIHGDCKREDISSRCHVCKTSTVARAKNRAIVTEMAKVFSGHKGIIGWQIDNEFFPYHDGCYCENCKKGFRSYLKGRFGTVEKLNKAWGMARWSLDYNTFDEVEPPYPEQWKHPSLQKAWWDFQCAQTKSYSDEQAQILHSYGCKNVGTDLMTTPHLSWPEICKELDVLQYNHYNPASELPDTAFWHDFGRCIKDKPFWVTETQVGWNGGNIAEFGYRPVGNAYANTWLAFAKGAEMNLYWLFRTHPNGHELAHGALYSTAGRMYRVSEEVQNVCKDMTSCGEFLNESKVKSEIALHFSSTAANSFVAAPMLKNFDYTKAVCNQFYQALSHYNTDVIDTEHSLEGYKVVISPFLVSMEENGLKERVIEWVKGGGTWIVGPMTDMMNGDVSKYTHAPYGFLEEFAGVYTKYQKPLDNDVFKAKWQDGQNCSISTYFDAFECNEGTKALAAYDGGEFGGYAVVTERAVGKGKVIVLGSVPSHDGLRRLIGLAPVAPASENVILTKRSGGASGIVAVEVKNQAGYVELDGEYLELISGKKTSGRVELPPHGVKVFVKA